MGSPRHCDLPRQPQDHQPFLHATLDWDVHDDRFIVYQGTFATWVPPAPDLLRPPPPPPCLLCFHVHEVNAVAQLAIALGAHALQTVPPIVLRP